MTESINARINRLADGIDRQEMQQLLVSVLTDLTTVKTQFNQLRTDYNTLAAQYSQLRTDFNAATVPTTATAVAATTATAVTLNTVA